MKIICNCAQNIKLNGFVLSSPTPISLSWIETSCSTEARKHLSRLLSLLEISVRVQLLRSGGIFPTFSIDKGAFELVLRYCTPWYEGLTQETFLTMLNERLKDFR
jgi:hypothetical protein